MAEEEGGEVGNRHETVSQLCVIEIVIYRLIRCYDKSSRECFFRCSSLGKKRVVIYDCRPIIQVLICINFKSKSEDGAPFE